MYYRERKESINPQLLALKKKKKSQNLPALGAPFSILLGNFRLALCNQQGNFWRALFNQ
jgi:hypothetical protein